MPQRAIAKVFKTIKYAVDYFTKECSSTSKDFFTFYQSVWETKVTENRKHYYSTLVQIRLRNPDQTKSGCYEVDLIFVNFVKAPSEFFTETLMFNQKWSFVDTKKYTDNQPCATTIWMGFESIYKSFENYKTY